LRKHQEKVDADANRAILRATLNREKAIGLS